MLCCDVHVFYPKDISSSIRGSEVSFNTGIKKKTHRKLNSPRTDLLHHILRAFYSCEGLSISYNLLWNRIQALSLDTINIYGQIVKKFTSQPLHLVFNPHCMTSSMEVSFSLVLGQPPYIMSENVEVKTVQKLIGWNITIIQSSYIVSC